MTIVTRIALSMAIGVGIAALVLAATHYHVFFFPFIIVLGAPLWWIWQPNRPPAQK